MLYFETVSSIIFDVSCLTVPSNISNLFIKANEKHNQKTRFSSSCNFNINRLRLNQNHGSFARFRAKPCVRKLLNGLIMYIYPLKIKNIVLYCIVYSICNELHHLPKRAFKKHINDMLFSLLEAEDNYVESPILLQKIANYRTNTEFNL